MMSKEQDNVRATVPMDSLSSYRLVGPDHFLIADHLARVFRIPAGKTVASCLAPDAPTCNQAALRLWVRRELARLANGPRVDRLLVVLEERLLAHLRAAFPGRGGEVDVPSQIALETELSMPRWERSSTCSPPSAWRRAAKKAASGKGLAAVNHKMEERNEYS